MIESIRWVNWTLVSSICDTLLVYFLIYKTLLLVRGTSAEPMLRGLAIVVLVYVATRVLGLATLNWVLGNFLGSVILVVVVLFQEDLRRGLIKVGLIRAFGGDTSQEMEGTINEIAKAAIELASRRIGALIVIRRNVGLEDYTENAIKIDSLVRHEVLVSMFLPTSPLHDGAMVIEGNRIAVAGAVLPLTFNPSISSSYGTRHRAAIGLSERTDAVVVVVSEEKGTVSVVREGRISKELTQKALSTTLYRLTVFRHQRMKRRRKFFGSLLGMGAAERAGAGERTGAEDGGQKGLVEESLSEKK